MSKKEATYEPTPKRDHCPHCGRRLTIKQIIWLMNGSGFVRHVAVRTKGGMIAVIEARDCNPNEVEILEGWVKTLHPAAL